jgi:peptidyl-prolyl cis-trans isomerase SurA
MRRLRSIATCWSTRTRKGPMRLTIKTPLVSSLILVVALLSSLGKGEIVDRIVAIVNEDIITLSELELFRKSLYPHEPKTNDVLSRQLDLLDARRRVLNALIEETLIDQEANRQKISVKENELKETLESIRQEQGLTQRQLEAALKVQGLAYEEYTAEVEKRLRRTKLITRVVQSEIEMEEEDLKTYYETHSNKYMADESIRISHILLPIPPNSPEDREKATLSMAKGILARVENGEDFDVLAREYTQNVPGARGGDTGYFKRGEMIPAIEETAFTLNIGEVGGGIRTPEGVVVIKVTDKKEGSIMPFAKVRKRVERDYYGSESQRRYREFLNKLKERSFIEVKL